MPMAIMPLMDTSRITFTILLAFKKFGEITDAIKQIRISAQNIPMDFVLARLFLKSFLLDTSAIVTFLLLFVIIHFAFLYCMYCMIHLFYIIFKFFCQYCIEKKCLRHFFSLYSLP